MKNYKLFKFQSNKAQISFELITILAVVTLIVSAIFLDFSKQADDTFILTNTKSLTLNELNKLNVQSDSNCYLKSMSFDSNQITLDIKGKNCVIPPSLTSLIANEVEKKYCQIQPNNDEVINCGEIYKLKII